MTLGLPEPDKVTVTSAVDVLPEASVAVSVTTRLPGTTADPIDGDCVTTTAPVDGQLSEVVASEVMSASVPPQGEPKVNECVAGALIVGDVVSLTVTEVVHSTVLPAASVAVRVTLVRPYAIGLPAAGTCVMATTPAHVSVAEAVGTKLGIRAPQAASADTVWGGAQAVKAGGVASSTTKVAVQVELLPTASATVSVMTCEPLARAVPASGDWVTTKEPAAVVLSVATTPAVKSGTKAVQLTASAFTDWVGPQDVITGAVVSTPVKVVVQVAVLPAASATVTVTVVAPRPTGVPAVGNCVRAVTPQLSAAAVAAVKSGRPIVPLPANRRHRFAEHRLGATRRDVLSA